MARFGSSNGPGNPGDDPYQTTRLNAQGAQPPGPSPVPFGPPNPVQQPDSAPTQYASYIPLDQQQPAAPNAGEVAAPPPTPWFRRRSVLIAWMALIVAMLALVIWGIIQLTSRGPGGSTTPGTSSSSTTTSSTTSSSESSSSESSSTTSSTSSSATNEPGHPAPPAAPPRGPQQPAPEGPEPTHHHHLPPLPSTITIPPVPKFPELPTIITLPPHL